MPQALLERHLGEAAQLAAVQAVDARVAQAREGSSSQLRLSVLATVPVRSTRFSS